MWGTTLEFLSRRLEIKEDYIKVSEIENFDGAFVLNSLLLCAVVGEVDGKQLKTDNSTFEEISHILRASL